MLTPWMSNDIFSVPTTNMQQILTIWKNQNTHTLKYKYKRELLHEVKEALLNNLA
jgi:hypothetical protein